MSSTPEEEKILLQLELVLNQLQKQTLSLTSKKNFANLIESYQEQIDILTVKIRLLESQIKTLLISSPTLYQEAKSLGLKLLQNKHGI